VARLEESSEPKPWTYRYCITWSVNNIYPELEGPCGPLRRRPMTRIRITYETHVEYMDVQATDPLGALAECLSWIRHQQRCRGVRRKIRSLEIEPRFGCQGVDLNEDGSTVPF
jgi:hypothetical protein